MKKYRTLLFYKYAQLKDAEKFAQSHLQFCKNLGIFGRVLIGDEGINGTVSGTEEQCKCYMNELRSDERLHDIIFKIDEEENISFAKMHVRYRKEIVRFGVEDVNVWEQTGRYLEPDEWEKRMNEDDVVILDARNKVEWEIGKFKNAVTLDIEHFRDFPNKISELEKLKEKKILAYCTGGIRCEKATAYLIQQGFKNVFHLHGGIIQYGKDTGGKNFDGKCYVFDNRLATEVNTINPTVISHCKICNTTSARMVNCANPECNEHFVLCENCGWKMEGTCSEKCAAHPRRRKYDGTGFYQKNTQQWVNEKAAKKKSFQPKENQE